MIEFLKRLFTPRNVFVNFEGADGSFSVFERKDIIALNRDKDGNNKVCLKYGFIQSSTGTEESFLEMVKSFKKK